MDQIQKSRLLPFIGFLLTSWFCHGQDDRFLPDVEGYRIDRESYVMIWDSVLRLPKVTAYEVTREELEKGLIAEGLGIMPIRISMSFPRHIIKVQRI